MRSEGVVIDVGMQVIGGSEPQSVCVLGLCI